MWDGGRFAFNYNNGYTFTFSWNGSRKQCRISDEEKPKTGICRLSVRFCGRGYACRIGVEPADSVD